MLHGCTYGEFARKENLNTAVLKNYRSHDRCLLSKWSHTCGHTHPCNMTKPCRKRVYINMYHTHIHNRAGFCQTSSKGGAIQHGLLHYFSSSSPSILQGIQTAANNSLSQSSAYFSVQAGVKVSRKAPERHSGARKFKPGAFQLQNYWISQPERTFLGPAS